MLAKGWPLDFCLISFIFTVCSSHCVLLSQTLWSFSHLVGLNDLKAWWWFHFHFSPMIRRCLGFVLAHTDWAWLKPLTLPLLVFDAKLTLTITAFLSLPFHAVAFMRANGQIKLNIHLALRGIQLWRTLTSKVAATINNEDVHAITSSTDYKPAN